MQKSIKGERIGAAIIDYMIFSFVSSIPAVALIPLVGFESFLTWLLSSEFTVVPDNFVLYTILNAVAALIIGLILYAIIPTKNNGQTLGKMMLKIRAVTLDNQNPSLSVHALRAIMLWSAYVNLPLLVFLSFDYFTATVIMSGASFLTGALVLVSVIMILANQDGRGLHDNLTKTQVISTLKPLVDEVLDAKYESKDDFLSDFDEEDPWSK